MSVCGKGLTLFPGETVAASCFPKSQDGRMNISGYNDFCSSLHLRTFRVFQIVLFERPWYIADSYACLCSLHCPTVCYIPVYIQHNTFAADDFENIVTKT